jgi:hypothetical protein
MIIIRPFVTRGLTACLPRLIPWMPPLPCPRHLRWSPLRRRHPRRATRRAQRLPAVAPSCLSSHCRATSPGPRPKRCRAPEPATHLQPPRAAQPPFLATDRSRQLFLVACEPFLPEQGPHLRLHHFRPTPVAPSPTAAGAHRPRALATSSRSAAPSSPLPRLEPTSHSVPVSRPELLHVATSSLSVRFSLPSPVSPRRSTARPAAGTIAPLLPRQAAIPGRPSARPALQPPAAARILSASP